MTELVPSGRAHMLSVQLNSGNGARSFRNHPVKIEIELVDLSEAAWQGLLIPTGLSTSLYVYGVLKR
jgi:hypothetical protein